MYIPATYYCRDYKNALIVFRVYFPCDSVINIFETKLRLCPDPSFRFKYIWNDMLMVVRFIISLQLYLNWKLSTQSAAVGTSDSGVWLCGCTQDISVTGCCGDPRGFLSVFRKDLSPPSSPAAQSRFKYICDRMLMLPCSGISLQLYLNRNLATIIFEIESQSCPSLSFRVNYIWNVIAADIYNILTTSVPHYYNNVSLCSHYKQLPGKFCPARHRWSLLLSIRTECYDYE